METEPKEEKESQPRFYQFNDFFVFVDWNSSPTDISDLNSAWSNIGDIFDNITLFTSETINIGVISIAFNVFL